MDDTELGPDAIIIKAIAEQLTEALKAHDNILVSEPVLSTARSAHVTITCKQDVIYEAHRLVITGGQAYLSGNEHFRPIILSDPEITIEKIVDKLLPVFTARQTGDRLWARYTRGF